MKNKALSILKTLNSEELKLFGLFVSSPYFNSSKALIKFTEVLNKFHPDFSSPMFTLANLKIQLKTTSDSTVKNLFADLYPLCLKFLAQSRFLDNPQVYHMQLINELENRSSINDELIRITQQEIEKIDLELKNQKEFHTSSIMKMFELEISKHNMGTFNAPVKNTGTLQKHINSYSNASEFLFYFYLLNAMPAYIMILNICELMSIVPEETRLGRFFNTFFTNENIDKLLHSEMAIRHDSIRNHCELYWLFLQIRLGNDMFGNSVKFINILKKTASSLHPDERFNFYTVFNIWTPDNLDHPEFEEYEFSFYDDVLENERYKNSGHEYMSVRNFMLLYTRGDTSGRYEWTDKLMEKYITALKPKYRISLIALRNGFLSILRDKNTEKAIIELNKVKDHGEIRIKRDIKYLGILIYYEKREFEYVFDLINSLSKFLNSKNTPKIEKLLFSKFIKFVKLLIKVALNVDCEQIKKLQTDIENEKRLPSKKWLLKKIEELKQ